MKTISIPLSWKPFQVSQNVTYQLELAVIGDTGLVSYYFEDVFQPLDAQEIKQLGLDFPYRDITVPANVGDIVLIRDDLRVMKVTVISLQIYETNITYECMPTYDTTPIYLKTNDIIPIL